MRAEADGLKEAVNRLFGALHERPTREEVSAWLAEHAQALERLLPEDDGSITVLSQQSLILL